MECLLKLQTNVYNVDDVMSAYPGHPPAPGVRGCLGGGQGRAQAAGSADRPLPAEGQHRQVRYRIQMGQRGFRFTLISFLIIRIYMTSSNGLTIAINHASHFSNGQWLLLAGIAQYDGGDSTECTVCSGEGARGKILRQCTTLISGLGGVKITLHIYSLAFSSLLMTTA